MKPVAFIAISFLLGATGLGYAATAVVPSAPTLSDTQFKLKQANQTIEQIKLKREKLLLQLQKLEKQVGISTNSLREMSSKISEKQGRLKHLSDEMKTQQDLLKAQNAGLARQVKAAFVMGRKEQLHLLLNQQNPALTSRMLVYYNYLNKNRLKELAALKSSIARLQQLEQEKHLESGSLEKVVSLQKNTQRDLSETKNQRQQLLIALKQEFNRQLGDLNGDEQQTQTLINQLLEQERQEALHPGNKQAANNVDIDGNPIVLGMPVIKESANFDSGVKKTFSQSQGHLPWPVKGAIIKKFGSPRSETRWDGVLIAAKEGTDIRAVSNGQVVFADWMKGYGWLIILNHGRGYMTLYAFNQTVYKKVGEQVKAGMVIGAVGSSGGREESGLYFGIRSNGKPVNPANWCAKRQ